MNKQNKRNQDVSGPIDPTSDPADLMNDTTGLTGVTVNNTSDSQPPSINPVSRTMSDAKNKFAHDISKTSDTKPLPSKKTPDPRDILQQNATGNEMINDSVGPSVIGEQSVSGSNPDPSSDDDTVLNAQSMGLALDEDEEHPKELDIGSDIDKAEEYHKTY